MRDIQKGHQISIKNRTFDCTCNMDFVDPMAIGAETLRIHTSCCFKREFAKLIRMNPK